MRSSIYVLFIVLFFVAGILSVSSCKNKCGSTTCQNGGTCSDNKCVCPTGYTGSSCETASNAPTIGTYNCTRSDCVPATTGGVTTWKSSVTAVAGNGYQVSISNFDNGNITVTGTVDSANNISIIPATGTYGISATGKYVNGTITLEYTTSAIAGGGYHCKMTMIKQ